MFGTDCAKNRRSILTHEQATALSFKTYRAWTAGESRERTHSVEQTLDGEGRPVRSRGSPMSLKPLVQAVDKVRCPVELKLHWKHGRRTNRAG
jgi:hypothetical protein